jgi:hypothetical protein
MDQIISWLMEEQIWWVLLMVGLGLALLIAGLICFSVGFDVGFARGRRHQARQGYAPRDASGKRLRERL